MLQFFLFCAMLIIISEAFSEKLHESQFLPSIRRKASRFSRTHNYLNPNIFNDLNFPKSLVTSTSENPDYESTFFVPLRRHGFVPKCDRNHFSQKKWRFSSRKKNFLNRRQQNYLSTSDVPVSSQSYKNFWPLGPEFCYKTHTNFFNSVFDSQRDLIKNPSQYIVCFYPVFNHLKKKAFCFLKKPRFTPSKGQYLNNLKNKRCANSLLSGTNDIIYKDNKLKVAECENHHKNIDVNMTDFESPNNYIFNTPPYTDEGSSVQKNDKNYNEKFGTYTSNFESTNNFRLNSSFTSNGTSMEEKNKNWGIINNNQDNVDIKKSSSKSPQKVKFYANSNLGSTRRNSLLSPLSSNHTSTHLDVTQPYLTLPKINFKYPYDPNLYDTPPGKESQTFLKHVKKERSNSEVRNETNAKEAFFQNLKKLRQMLEEVESALKSSINDKMNKKEKRSKKKEKKKKKKGKNDGGDMLSNSTSIKDKIDNLAIPILRNISDELAKMSNETILPSTSKPFIYTVTDPDKSKSASNKTDERCSLNGTWTSTVLGIEMTVTVMPNMMLKVSIHSKDEAIINGNWSIHGLTLVKRGGPLMFAAVYPQGRKVASFLGQCKVGKDSDLIFGAWTIYSCVRKYTDLWRAVETKLDILRKKKA